MSIRGGPFFAFTNHVTYLSRPPIMLLVYQWKEPIKFVSLPIKMSPVWLTFYLPLLSHVY